MHVVILAAQRAGEVNPLAVAHGVSHKCLVPIVGSPLIEHVFRAVAAAPGVSAITVVIEPEASAPVSTIADGIAGLAPVRFVAAAANLADSVIAGTDGIEGHVVITTADNVQVTPAALCAMEDALTAGADVAIAMARKGDVLAAHPEGQRRFYEFADDAYSNCNLYALAGRHALRAAETFRSGGQFAKNAGRIAEAFGIVNLVLLRLGWVSLEGGLRRISRRFGLKVVPVILADGRHAIDVDNERTYRVAETLMRARASADPVRPA
jgi:hypothetical protein